MNCPLQIYSIELHFSTILIKITLVNGNDTIHNWISITMWCSIVMPLYFRQRGKLTSIFDKKGDTFEQRMPELLLHGCTRGTNVTSWNFSWILLWLLEKSSKYLSTHTFKYAIKFPMIYLSKCLPLYPPLHWIAPCGHDDVNAWKFLVRINNHLWFEATRCLSYASIISLIV